MAKTKYSDADLLGLLRARAKELGHDPTPDEYEHWGLKPAPSVDCITSRFGSWEMALRHAAGEGVCKTFGDTATTPKLLDWGRIEADKAIVIADLHIPYHEPLILAYANALAQAQGVKRLIVAGDLFDFSQFSRFSRDFEAPDTDGDIIKARGVINLWADVFERIYLTMGNHDKRFAEKVQDEFRPARLLETVCPAHAGKTIFWSPYPYCELTSNGVKWRITHPKSYSMIPARAAIWLAEKYDVNVIAGHCHVEGMGYTKNGKYIGAGVGSACDCEKIPWLMKQDSRHPVWTVGLALVRNGSLTLFNMLDTAKWERFLGREEMERCQERAKTRASLS